MDRHRRSIWRPLSDRRRRRNASRVLWEHIRRTECGFRNGGQAAGPSYRVNNGFRLGLPLAFKKEEQPEANLPSEFAIRPPSRQC